MPESKGRNTGESAGKSKGGRALLGAAMAIVGALAAVSEPPGVGRRK